MSAYQRTRESDGLARGLAMLRNRKSLIVAITLACVLVTVVRHEMASKSYAAMSSVAFQSGTLSDAAFQVSTSGTSEPEREAATEVLIAHSPEVAKGVRVQLGTPAKPTELLDQVKVEAAPNANILNITATTGSPRTASLLANAFAQQYIAFRARSELAGIQSAERKLESQVATLPVGSAERATVEQSLQRLGELRAVAGNGASIIGLASPPSSPTGSGIVTTAIVGLLIGLALSFALVFVLESVDRRVKSVEDFEREYRLPVLSVVPNVPFRGGDARQREELLEPYRILRSALDFAAVSRELRTLMVTSAISGEGKTTVSVDLAHAIALAGRRVVLVELDLRRPSFANHFALSSGDGFTTALTRNVRLEELMVEPFEDLPNLSVLPSGPLPHNPSELLASAKVAELIDGLTSSEGIVILDAPPLNPVADAQALLSSPIIDAAIVVARLGKTTHEDIKRVRAILDRQMAEPVGVVVTGAPRSSRYGYETYSAVPPPPPPDGRRGRRTAGAGATNGSSARIIDVDEPSPARGMLSRRLGA